MQTAASAALVTYQESDQVSPAWGFGFSKA